MKQRTMTLEQAYRYALRRVDRLVRSFTVKHVRISKYNERFPFNTFGRKDAMAEFLDEFGYHFVEAIEYGKSYKKV